MWLGKQGRLRRESGGAELGVTSIPGTEAAVLAGGESRALPVYGPGGCCWVPEAGQRVLLIRGGPGGEEQCVAGAAQGAAPAVLGLRGSVALAAGPTFWTAFVAVKVWRALAASTSMTFSAEAVLAVLASAGNTSRSPKRAAI